GFPPTKEKRHGVDTPPPPPPPPPPPKTKQRKALGSLLRWSAVYFARLSSGLQRKQTCHGPKPQTWRNTSRWLTISIFKSQIPNDEHFWAVRFHSGITDDRMMFIGDRVKQGKGGREQGRLLQMRRTRTCPGKKRSNG
ncbi:MAG: hypothetical protein BJ554DRAFT_3739, partial [Olpidium bornovanus]